MKKKALLFGTLPALALASGIFLSNSDSSTGNYEPRLSSHLEADNASAEGAFEYYSLIKGDFTAEDLQRSRSLANAADKNRATYNWVDQGPDNIGGRTRAIVCDRNDINHVYAGSVSGGLYESFNRGNLWNRVDNFTQNMAISSMCQTKDGRIWVATGHQEERSGGSQNAFDTGANGYGLYYLEDDGSWALVDGSEGYTYINEVVSDTINNQVWFATSSGLKKYSVGGTIEDVDAFDNNSCNALAISPDGTVMVGYGVGGGPSAVWVSNNSGSTFTDVAGSDPGQVSLASVGRIDFAISHEKVDGNYRVYASCASGQLEGVWRSANSGTSFDRIAPAYDGAPGGFSPFTAGVGSSGQGLYNNIITVVPGAPDRILLGGIDCYSWSTTGNWEQISQWFLSPTSSSYVHADNHEMTWDAWGRLYIGNDGGVGISDNANSADPDFYPANRGYNVTQFYATGVSAHGDVVGGTQDNGTLANYHTGTTYQEHRQIFGGDGFSADISFINRNLNFSSIYYSFVARSSDRGANTSPFVPEEFFAGTSPCTPGSTGGDGCGQFFTNFEMWENPNDELSQDSVRYIPSDDFSIGDIIEVPSATSQTTIEFVSPINVVFDDTLDANPAFTIDDILVIDLLTGVEYNLGIVDWEFISGASEVSEGDSLFLTGLSDTIIVDDISTIDHFFGTNPLKPGQFVDMGNDEQIFNVAWDTLKVKDPFQSWFALDMGGSNGLWMSRNALRFSATDQGWFKAADGIGSVSSMEYTKDGNTLFIGTFSGALWRLTGFNDAYTPSEHFEGPTVGGITYDTLVSVTGERFVTELEQLTAFGAPVTGIASGPIGDPDYLVVTLGNYTGSGKVRECTNALAVSPTFTPFASFPSSGEGAAAVGIPCYSVIVDRDDMNTIVVGTEFGVFVSENGGTSWENVNGAFGAAPIYDMQQNWRTYDEGCLRPGEIYLGTHGRGIWSSDALLSLPNDNDNTDVNKFVPNINLYPNPVSDAGTVEFDLENNGDVTLQIFNLNGQVVRTVTAQNLNAGANQIAFDANDLPTGTYILRLNSETMSETTKFIKR